jgi:hypothetical protein
LSYLKVLSEHLFGQNEDDCGKLRHESLCPRRNSRRVKSQIRQKHHHVSQPALFQMLLAVNTTVITLDRINHFRTGRCRSEDNIKMHLKEIGCDIMIVWIEFIWLRTVHSDGALRFIRGGGDSWPSGLALRFIRGGGFLIIRVTIIFSRMTLPHTVS